MKVGIISDTHDNLMSLKKAIEIFKENKIELILHCGDWVAPFTVEYLSQNIDVPIKGVLGNNKGDIKRTMQRNANLKNPVEFPKSETLEVEIDGKKTVVYHGEDPLLLEALIASKSYDVVFTGHTHTIRNEKINGVVVVNPGTTCYASGGGIIDYASVAIYDSTKNSAEIIKF
jgi:putative phosphoesterase